MIHTLSQSIDSLVKDIKDGKLLLPELQRSSVWKSTQVRDLFDSLYHEYPSGQLLVWETDELPSGNRTASIAGIASNPYSSRLLLDGQQRLTSLSTIMLGEPLEVHDTQKKIDIAFNVFTEKFEVAGSRHSIQSNWISLTNFFTEGETAILQSILTKLDIDFKSPETKTILEHLSKLNKIKNYTYHVNVLSHMSYAEVTHIFIRTNSGGTILGNSDLALAQISSYCRGITKKFEEYQHDNKKHFWGLAIDNALLLRALIVVLTGQSSFTRIFRTGNNFSVDDIEAAWERTKIAFEKVISFLVHNCLIDHLEMLPTRNILISLVAFFDRFGTSFTDSQARELQRWVYMALIWTRYSGASDTALAQDIAALSKDQPILSMIQNIENDNGGRPVTEQELRDQRKNSPYMLMTYVLAKQTKAQDWFTGIGIGTTIHHIFPKSLLGQKYDLRKYSKIVDQVANLIFLESEPKKALANRSPAHALMDIDEARLKAQYIPLDRTLWENDQFERFTLRRREILADAINQLLLSLSNNKAIWTDPTRHMLETRVDATEHILRKLIAIRLTEARGENAWEHLIDKSLRSNIESRIKKDETSKPFNTGKHATLYAKLQSCLFSELFRIINDNWILFSDAFGNEVALQAQQKPVVEVRNKLKHGQDLSAFEIADANAGLLWLDACLQKINLDNDEDVA